MTAGGRQVKTPNIFAEVGCAQHCYDQRCMDRSLISKTQAEVFLYDRRVLSSTSVVPPSLGHEELNLAPSPIQAVPSSASKDATLHSWQAVFRQRRRWASDLAKSIKSTLESIHTLQSERDVIRRGSVLAVSNVRQHMIGLQSKLEHTRRWTDEILEDQRRLQGKCSNMLEKCSSIHVIEDFGQCISSGPDSEILDRHSGENTSTLAAFFDAEEVQRCYQLSPSACEGLVSKVRQHVSDFGRIRTEASRVQDNFSPENSISDSQVDDRSQQLLEEIEVLAKKMDADCETIQALVDVPKSLTQAARTAYLHENTFITSFVQTNEEANHLYQQVSELRQKTGWEAAQTIQQVSSVESRISSFNSTLAEFNINDETSVIFETLDRITRLPLVYGSILIEFVRRQEWREKAFSSSSISEKTVPFKAEESKRRQRWSRDMGDAVNSSALDAMTPQTSLDPESGNDGWPIVSRQDIEDYLSNLTHSGGFADVIRELKESIKILDSPTKQQAKKVRGFKNGSLHEATFDEPSLVLRGDDDAVRVLRRDKQRLEDRLKSAESRIRKLEDLLHRQSQIARPPSVMGLGINNGNFFERVPTSPAPNHASALSKAHEPDGIQALPLSRRVSFNQESENKSLVQKIASLEAELLNQKGQSKEFEKLAAAKANSEDLLKLQVREAISTKEDLLSNFEAQQQEVDSERRLLNDENKKLKLKLEELEDEFDRVCGSHEHEYRVQLLEEDLDNTRKEAATEIHKAHDELQSTRSHLAEERERSDELEKNFQALQREIKTHQSENADLTSDIRSRDRSTIDSQSVLLSALLRISQDADAPDDFGALVHALGVAVDKCVSQQIVLQESVRAAQSEKASLEDRQKAYTSEVDGLHADLTSQQSKVTDLQINLDQERSRSSNLESQLATLTEECYTFKNKLDENKAEIAAFQARMQEKEGEVRTLTKSTEEVEVQKRDVEMELEDKRSEFASLEGSYVRLNSARDLQATRADEISTHFFLQIGKLRHLLEQLGFMITNQDEAMIVQRASRTNTGMGGSIDPSASMKRSISLPPLTKDEVESSISPSSLHWAKAVNSEEATQAYIDFSKATKMFDIDTFTEVTYRRLKEVEHIARKSQRESRLHRDKSQRAQNEAHDRLALRSFKEGDLALFLPTREPSIRFWAAFHIGAPHFYILREQDSHKLNGRDWLLARISKVEERVVNLSQSMNGLRLDSKSALESGVPIEDENPYDLADGTKWFQLDAVEEKPGAPINVGLGKTTVASVNVDAQGTLRLQKTSGGNGVTKTLTRSLDSRRSSSNSKKGLSVGTGHIPATLDLTVEPSASSMNIIEGHAQEEEAGPVDAQAGASVDKRPDKVGSS